jgi:hypothetical protein
MSPATFQLSYPLPIMKFTLTYDGPLVSSANDQRTREKQAIRKALHPQLEELLKVHPALAEWQWRYENVGQMRGNLIKSRCLITIIEIGELHLVPLFASDIDVTCHLDILFLRRSKPGGIIHAGGDVDNRLLTLFDALKTPATVKELGIIQESLPKPFYCLMQDDSQISGFSVRTGQLLHPMNDSSADVRLVIDVTVEVRRVTMANTCLIGE